MIYRRARFLEAALPTGIPSAIWTIPCNFRDQNRKVLWHRLAYVLVWVFFRGLSMLWRKPRVVYVLDALPQSRAIVRFARLYGVKIVADIGDLPMAFWGVAAARSYDKAIVKFHTYLLSVADATVFRGRALKDETERLLEVRNPRPEIIYDPVEPEFFARSEDKREARAHVLDRLAIDKDQFIVGYSAGNIRLNKIDGVEYGRGAELILGIGELDPAFRRRVTILLTGGGPGQRNLQQLAVAAGVDVRFVGMVPFEELIELVLAHDLSYLEGFDTPGYRAMIGSKLQQYMAAGNHVIAVANGERLLWQEALETVTPLASDLSNLDEVKQEIARVVRHRMDTVRTGEQSTAFNALARETAEKVFSGPTVQQTFARVSRAILTESDA